MCIINEHGIKLNNGKQITFDNPDLSQLSPKELEEISTTPMMMLGSFYLHKDMRHLQKSLDEISEELKSNLATLKLHTGGCPVNPKAIRIIVDDHVKHSEEINNFLEQKWWNIFKDKMFAAKKLILAAVTIFGLLAALLIASGKI